MDGTRESRRPPAVEVDPLVGRTVASRYRILKRVGEGAMGAVYLAEHVALKKHIALKFLHAELSRRPDVVARFEREAVTAARLEHPNVVAAHDFGTTDDGVFFLAMEYVEGPSLRDALASAGSRLSPARALHVARHVAGALARAQQIGVVHRDLKPENVVLVERGDDRDFAKVIDFGIARLQFEKGDAGVPLTQAGMVLGTPEYMAPEQAMGLEIDHRADLYAFAVMVFETLAGRLPFVSDDPVVLITRHLEAPPPRASELAPPGVLPRAVDAVFERALAKQASQRYGSATEFVDSLADALAQPVALPSIRTKTLPNAVVARGNASTTEPELPAAARGRVAARLRALVASRAARISAAVAALAVLSIAAGVATSPPAAPRRAARAGEPAARGREGHPAAPRPRAPAAVAERPAGDGEPAAASTELAARLAALRARPEVRDALGSGRPADVRRALAALEPERARSPRDGALAAVVAALHAREPGGGPARAVARFTDAIRLEPALAADDDVARDVVRAGLLAPAAPANDALLSGPVSRAAAPHVLDAVMAPPSPAARRRAQALLALPAYAPYLDATVRGLLAYAEARTCAQKRAAVGQLRREGDGRALRYLRRIRVGTGCGFLGLGECNPCLADHVPAAIRAIEARAR